jgi:hypothetical protein
MSEDTETGDEALTGNARLVAESVRYHKRAQTAEQKVKELTEQLDHAKSETVSLTEQLDKTKIEQQLIRKLVSAGSVDIETALLVAKGRINDNSEADLDGVVEQLKKEKSYLFAEQKNGDAVTTKKTASAKDRLASNSSALERAAKKAAASGSTTDLQHYLKLRRNYV